MSLLSSKITVSYWMIGGYAAFVVVSTLLVGILPALVDLPTCDPPSARDSAVRSGHVPWLAEPAKLPVPNHIPAEHHAAAVPVRAKREAEEVAHVKTRAEELKESFEAKQKRVADHYAERMEDPVFAHFAPEPRAQILFNASVCTEILFPQAGVSYPWYDPRLPADNVPTNYNVQILLTEIGFTLFDGFINITFTAANPSNYVLLHVGPDEIPFLIAFIDSAGNDVAVECVGQFPYLRNDYYIIKTSQPLTAGQSYVIEFVFLDFYTNADAGIFKVNYGAASDNATMVLSKFQPIDARRAFPIFDEPKFKATWDFTIMHRPDFYPFFNTPILSSAPDANLSSIQVTKFMTTPPMAPQYIACAVINSAHWAAQTSMTSNNITVNFWARKQFHDAGLVADPLNMAVGIYNAYLDLFSTVNANAIPLKIDIIAVPEYPIDAIGHWGLVIAEEDKILYFASDRDASGRRFLPSERDKQNIALRLARCLGSFWFGNYMTHSWWDELWISEGFTDYVKYRAVDEAFPDWNVLQQFLTEELVPLMLIDGYPSAHPIYKPISNPYEIEEYYDEVESSKMGALLRMVANEFNEATMETAFAAMLNGQVFGNANINLFYNAIGRFGTNNWDPVEFFNRWTMQPNFPLINAQIITNAGVQSIQFTQTRALNTEESVFGGDTLYPSNYNWTWYIPLECSFGNSSNNADGYFREAEFYIDQQTATFPVPGGATWTWFHCNRKFITIAELDYPSWDGISGAMAAGNFELTPEDRAQIISNMFLNAYSERGDYNELRRMLDYLPAETDYLPWRTVLLNVRRIGSVLQFRRTFQYVAEYFSYISRQFELSLDLWTPGGEHTQELLKETIIELSCSMMDIFCLNNVTALWVHAVPLIQSGEFDNVTLPAYARAFIYDYHMQNTYDIGDWDLIMREYDVVVNPLEQKRLITALTFSRLPWLLTRLMNAVGDEFIQKIDFFEILARMTEKPLGRELMWDYFRLNFATILSTYGQDDSRIGQALLDITWSFETEFLFYELLQLVFFTTTGATANARFKALETVSTNLVWLGDKEAEIRAAFNIRPGGPGSAAAPKVSMKRNPLIQPEDQNSGKAVAARLRDAFKKQLRGTNLEVWADLKKALLQ